VVTGLYGSVQWRALRLYVLERDGWRCRICAEGCTGEATQADHIVAVAEGGPPFDPLNCRAACEFCNKSRGGALGNRRRRERERALVYPPRLEW
jgi:5-methylcytosine-specific restriction protein A